MIEGSSKNSVVPMLVVSRTYQTIPLEANIDWTLIASARVLTMTISSLEVSSLISLYRRCIHNSWRLGAKQRCPLYLQVADYVLYLQSGDMYSGGCIPWRLTGLCCIKVLGIIWSYPERCLCSISSIPFQGLWAKPLLLCPPADPLSSYL